MKITIGWNKMLTKCEKVQIALMASPKELVKSIVPYIISKNICFYCTIYKEILHTSLSFSEDSFSNYVWKWILYSLYFFYILQDNKKYWKYGNDFAFGFIIYCTYSIFSWALHNCWIPTWLEDIAFPILYLTTFNMCNIISSLHVQKVFHYNIGLIWGINSSNLDLV